jgi:glutamate dehydrogenase/leucine dehydrogenase
MPLVAQALTAIEERMRANTRETLERARAGGLLPREAAIHMARARVEDAMRYRKA